MPSERQFNFGMTTSSLRSLPPPDATSHSSQTIITLQQARSGPRVPNEYVDSPRPLSCHPLKSQGVGGGVSPHLPQHSPGHRGPSSGSRGGGGVVAAAAGGAAGAGGGGGGRPPTLNTTIITQPSSVSPPLKKDVVDAAEGEAGHNESIICNKCGKCRCGACTEPRELPSRWLCSNKYEVGAEAVVEYCTCFCFLKGIFYHCGAQDDEDTGYSCYDDPCACCSGPHCCKRWTCIAMMSMCFPCLWCYWPAKGCLAACTSCYNKCRPKGCQCSRKADRTSAKHSQSQTRRLLIESDSSSA